MPDIDRRINNLSSNHDVKFAKGFKENFYDRILYADSESRATLFEMAKFFYFFINDNLKGQEDTSIEAFTIVHEMMCDMVSMMETGKNGTQYAELKHELSISLPNTTQVMQQRLPADNQKDRSKDPNHNQPTHKEVGHMIPEVNHLQPKNHQEEVGQTFPESRRNGEGSMTAPSSYENTEHDGPYPVAQDQEANDQNEEERKKSEQEMKLTPNNLPN